VQAFASLHAVPTVLAGLEHTPDDVLQVPAVWHWSDAAHTTGSNPVQAPIALHSSFRVQAFVSLHAVPGVFAGLEHTPDDVSHVPASWHWSDAIHVLPAPAAQLPAWHVSDNVHAFPSVHVVPSVLAGSEHAPDDVSHAPALWHWSDAVHV
jgi:hypothetical protein